MSRWLPVLLVMAALSLGCDNSSNSGTTTAPTVPLTNQTFTGSIDVGGSSSNTFVAAQAGEVDVTVSALAPPSNIIVGLSIGIPSTVDPTSCLVQSGAAPTQVSASNVLSGSLAAGTWCVKLSDLGYMSAPVNYTIIVAHP
jgi:hypothetical protein